MATIDGATEAPSAQTAERPNDAGGQSDSRPSLTGLNAVRLAEQMADLGVPAPQASMRARQLFHWVYARGARDFDAMTTLPNELRARLASQYRLDRPEIATAQTSTDGTRKWLLKLADGQLVETVYIPETDRGTLCISTQVGCSLTCRFCHTGTMPLVRNLDAGEILAQILVARDALDEWPTPKGPGSSRRLSNIVVMGMGEPLLNYEHCAEALRIAMDSDGLDFSRHKITVSTSGIVPKIETCGRELGVGLAISLHAVRDELRDELVPINSRWNLAALMAACRGYPGGRRVTFEYVMLDGVNDSDADAHQLVRLIDGIDAKVNLIPFNPWPGAPYRCSPSGRIAAFAAIVASAGYQSPVRTPRGRDILAACGQLKTASIRQRRRALAVA